MLRLRPTRADELDFVMTAERDPANSPFVSQWTRLRHAEAIERDDMAHLIVERESDATPVGYVILAGVGTADASVELLRVVITEKGQGYGREVVRRVKHVAFELLGAHRLWLDVRDHNTRARSLYEREGFVVEGTLRECNRVGDRFESLVVMSILDREYRAQ